MSERIHADEPDDAPRVPTDAEWRAHGIRPSRELHGGHQSRVFLAELDGQQAAVKLTDVRFADVELLTARMQIVETLGALTDLVVPSVRIGGGLTRRMGEWFATATRYVTGRAPDLTSIGDGRRLGATLAELHATLRGVEAPRLPPMPALVIDDRRADRPAAWQLLHGDFSDRNVIVTPDGPRVIDFDDGGTGPVEYDLANSLYMVLFDDATASSTAPRSEAFRPAFLAGYASASDTPIDVALIDEMVELRISALAGWIDDLSTAPIGIRTASPEWHRTLRRFVNSRLRTDPTQPGPTADDG